MKFNLKKAASIAALVLLFFVLLAVFVYYRYPWDSLKTRLVDEISSHHPVVLKIGKIKPSVPISLKIEGIAVYQKSPSRLLLKMEELKVKPKIWGLVFGRPCIKLKGTLYGGSLSGRVKEVSKGKYEVDFLVRNVSIGEYNWRDMFVGEENSIRLDGTLDFSISGLADSKLEQQNLTGSVAVDNLALLDGKITNVDLPNLTFPSVAISFEVKGSQLTIKPTTISSDSLEARLQGTVSLRRSWEQSLCNLEAKLKFKGDLKESLDPLLRWVRSKDAEGFYQVNISGQLKSIKLK